MNYGLQLYVQRKNFSKQNFCCQKWHLLCVFIAMPAILYLLLDEVCSSSNRQTLVCVLMSKNAFLKVFPL